MNPLPAAAVRWPAGAYPPPPDMKARPAKKKLHLDVFSPPVLLGSTYLLLFGVGIVDIEYFNGRTALRSSLLYFRGLSREPLVYLAQSLLFFLAGYFLTPAGAITRHVRPAQRQWALPRTSAVTTMFFLFTFAVLVAYIVTVGYGRYSGTGDETFANLSLLGELSMIPMTFSLVRDAHHRSGDPGAEMSQWDRRFLWGVMVPGQLLLSLVIGVRSRAVMVVLTVLAAQHYGCRRMRPKWFLLIGALLLFVAVPLMQLLRDRNQMLVLPQESGSYSVRAWQSVADRTSSVETFTVIYENLERVPKPDPMYWTILTGLVPRFLWPGKPMFTFNERLTRWAVGAGNSGWMGATLPGELILLQGPVGGLIFMALVGALWRALKDIARVEEKGAWVVLYIVSLRTLLNVEVGFVIPYSTLLRFIVVTCLLVYVTTVKVGHHVTQPQPATVPPPPFPRAAPAGR